MKNLVNTEIIKNYLKENKLSKENFCKQCKICLETLNRILDNESEISLVSLFKIAVQMNVNFHELFTK